MKTILNSSVMAMVMVKAVESASHRWAVAADLFASALNAVDAYREEGAGRMPSFLHLHYVRVTEKAEQACRSLGMAQASLKILTAELAVGVAEAEAAEAPEWTQGFCSAKKARLALAAAKKDAKSIPTLHDRMEVRGWHAPGGDRGWPTPNLPSFTAAPFPCSWDLESR